MTNLSRPALLPGPGHLRVATPEAPARLVILHHAAGSAASYLPLARGLVDVCEPVLLDLPGRGTRRDEPPAADFAAAVAALLPVFTAVVDRPTVVVGHSLGGLLAHHLVAGSEPGARARIGALVVSAALSPPSAAQRAAVRGGRRRDRDELLGVLRLLGGVPEEDLHDGRLIEYAVGLLGDDLLLADSYREPPGAVGMPDVHVWLGNDDRSVPATERDRWRREVGHPVSVTEFRGGHFFLTEHPSPARALRRLLGDAPARTGRVTAGTDRAIDS